MKDKATKRAEAVERQARHGELSALDKLAKVSKRPGRSARERARILAQLDQTTAAVAA